MALPSETFLARVNHRSEAWAVLVGGYIFSHKFRIRPRLLMQRQKPPVILQG